MGRYYSGDIEGKFWFGVQSSNAASRFGVEPNEPAYLHYYFDEEHIEDIEAELKKIKYGLGEYFEKLTNFFNEDKYMWNDDELLQALNLSVKENYSKYKKTLKEYADYLLGGKILKCVKKHGTCEFEAEV